MRQWLCAFVMTTAVPSPALAGPEEALDLEWKIVHFHRSAVPGRPN